MARGGWFNEYLQKQLVDPEVRRACESGWQPPSSPGLS